MMIDFRKAEVFEREMLQALQRSLDGQTSGSHFLEESLTSCRSML